MNLIRKFSALALALTLTGISIAMVIESANQRASGDHDKLLLAGVSMCIVLAVHLLPALLRQRSKWALWSVWSLCLLVAVYSHANYFSVTSQAAAEARQADSVQARAMAMEVAEIERTLKTIPSKSVTILARLHAQATDDAKREALEVELAEAQRAAKLRDRLVTLRSNELSNGYSAVTDPVMSRVTSVMGLGRGGHEVAGLAVSVLMALLIEMLGMMLWREVFSGRNTAREVVSAKPEIQERTWSLDDAPRSAAVQPSVVPNAPVSVDDLAALRAAIGRGECTSKIDDIRRFMGVGTATAQRFRRALLAA